MFAPFLVHFTVPPDTTVILHCNINDSVPFLTVTSSLAGDTLTLIVRSVRKIPVHVGCYRYVLQEWDIKSGNLTTNVNC